jgi:hypothetical protein
MISLIGALSHSLRNRRPNCLCLRPRLRQSIAKQGPHQVENGLTNGERQ